MLCTSQLSTSVTTFMPFLALREFIYLTPNILMLGISECWFIIWECCRSYGFLDDGGWWDSQKFAERVSDGPESLDRRDVPRRVAQNRVHLFKLLIVLVKRCTLQQKKCPPKLYSTLLFFCKGQKHSSIMNWGQNVVKTHSVFSFYLLTKHIALPILRLFLSFVPK